MLVNRVRFFKNQGFQYERGNRNIKPNKKGKLKTCNVKSEFEIINIIFVLKICIF